MSYELRPTISSEKELNSIITLAKREMSTGANMMKRSFVKLGYYLKQLRDGCIQGLEEVDYKQYAAEHFGMEKSMVARCIQINDKYSVGGDSMRLASRYEEFSKSQLIEMINVDEENMDNYTPDMTIAQMRQQKKVDEGRQMEVQEEIQQPQEEIYTFEETEESVPMSGLQNDTALYDDVYEQDSSDAGAEIVLTDDVEVPLVQSDIVEENDISDAISQPEAMEPATEVGQSEKNPYILTKPCFTSEEEIESFIDNYRYNFRLWCDATSVGERYYALELEGRNVKIYIRSVYRLNGYTKTYGYEPVEYFIVPDGEPVHNTKNLTNRLKLCEYLRDYLIPDIEE